MSIQKNVQIVKDFFAAMGSGDKQGLLALTAEDIEWIIPGEDWALAGTHRGHAGLADLLQKASTTVETLFPEPPEFVAQGDRVLVVGFAKGRIKATNRTWEDHWVFTITVRNGAARAVEHLRSSRLRCEWFRPRPPSTLAAPISCRPPQWVQTSPSKTSKQACLPPRSRLWMSSSGGPMRRWRRRPLDLEGSVAAAASSHELFSVSRPTVYRTLRQASSPDLTDFPVPLLPRPLIPVLAGAIDTANVVLETRRLQSRPISNAVRWAVVSKA
jgi:ketosteroid isomerase-like protein